MDDRFLDQPERGSARALPRLRSSDIEVIGPDGEPVLFDDDDDDEDVDDEDFIDLKEAFGLPDRLPPVRLPPEDELAAAARDSRLLRQVGQLVQWVDEHAPAITEDAELTAADTVAAARVLGIIPSGQATPGGSPAEPELRQLADLPELMQLWELAEELEFIDLDEESARVGAGFEDWPDGDDEDVLEIWQHALADTLDQTLVLAADLDSRHDLDFTGAGAACFVMLFLGRGEGIPVEELRDMIRSTAIAELPPASADKAWRSWTDPHGDPADALLSRLAELGAVRVDAEVARLTPLASYAMRLQLIDGGVEVPLLPPVAEMSASQLVAVGTGPSEQELADEAAAWLALRSVETAVEELLEVATTGGPMERIIATSIATKIGAEAQPRWRRALDEPTLRPYAKIALTEFAGVESGEVLPGLEPTGADLAWLLTDTLAAVADPSEPDELVQQLDEAMPAGQEVAVFEEIRRLDHPYAYEVLATIGKHHPRKQTAKAARTAAYKLQPSTKK